MIIGEWSMSINRSLYYTDIGMMSTIYYSYIPSLLKQNKLNAQSPLINMPSHLLTHNKHGPSKSSLLHITT